MICCNLNPDAPAGNPVGKGLFRGGVLFTALLLALAGCAEDAPTTLPEDFSYEGSYVLVWVSTTRDQSNDVAFDRNAATGLLEISDNQYTLDAVFGSDAFGFGDRSEAGKISPGDGYVDFIADSVATQSVPRGVYDIETNQLKVNYLKSDWLWTEIWQRASPVSSLQ